MDKIDQFESVFRASSKARFKYQSIHLGKVLLISDLGNQETERVLERVQHFLRDTHKGDRIEWASLSRGDYQNIRDLLARIDEAAPDLVVTQRCLTEVEKNPPFSLGLYLDVLTQITRYPILVLPDPESADFEKAMEHLREVVVVTDHLAGDSHIINWAARFVPREGKLVLTHVEDDAAFARYKDVLGKIPDIDTELASEQILAQLLKEPGEFIADARRVFEEEKVPIEVVAEIRTGHAIKDYQEILDAHEGDLLVMNTKVADQMAMQGSAYAIAIEYRHVALLLL